MTRFSSVRSRAATIVGAVAFLALGSVPLIGQAQDAAPAGDPTEQQLIADGEKIYTNVCIACHQPNGKGVDGIYLPLAGNPLLTTEDPTYFVRTVMTGRGGMPPFAGPYDDEQIAAITTYVRQAWGNDAAAVSPEQVAAVRAEITGVPVVQPTPEGQIPSGNVSGTPVSGAATAGTPEATP